MSKIRYGTSSKKGLIRSKAFPRTTIINLKRLIVATVPAGPFVPFAPGTLWYGPSPSANTMYRPRDFAALADDTATHWGFVIQENGLNSSSFIWQNVSSIQGKRIKINTPNSQNNFDAALAGVEFEITNVMPTNMMGYLGVNIGFKVPKSFLPVLPADQNSWEIPGTATGTFSIYTP
jgi:hypothetical protein